MYLIDTDWIVDYLKGRESARQVLDSLVPDGIAISLITYGEIMEGIYFGRDPERHEAIFRSFLRAAPIVSLTETSMEHFARVRGHLRSTGQIIGDADVLIAATALDHDLVLVTQNMRHFSRVPSLKLYHTITPD
jgi:tRNA(fMet)-specific endonuclease VapC